ncbi:MAG: DUF5678 domain-containing protein [Blastocatellia bacterium]
MSVEMLDAIKQQVSGLSLREKTDLLRFLHEQTRQDTAISSPVPDIDRAEIIRRKRMEWLKGNAEEHGGQYVALEEDRLVATGVTFRAAKEAAAAAGKENVFVTYLPKPDEVLQFGGWS